MPLRRLAPEDLPDLRVRLHPSLALLESRFPVVSIWQANRQDRDEGNDNMLREWKPECALIARPRLEVEVRPLSAGVYAFIAALAEGQHGRLRRLRKAWRTSPASISRECFNVLIAADIVDRPGASRRPGRYPYLVGNAAVFLSAPRRHSRWAWST